jgi:hypothetical protein
MSTPRWEELYPGRAPADGHPSAEECEDVARAALARGYQQVTVTDEQEDGAGPVRLDEEPNR